MANLHVKIWILFAIVFLVVVLFVFNTDFFLKLLGFDEELIEDVMSLGKLLLLNVFGYGFFQIYRFYLMALHDFNFAGIMGVASLVLHIIVCEIFKNYSSLPLVKVAVLSEGLTEILAALAVFIYVKVKNECPESLSLKVDWKNLKFCSFAGEVFMHGSSLYMETITFEITAIIVSLLHDDITIAAHASTLNFLYVCTEIFYGIGLASNTFAGNAAG